LDAHPDLKSAVRVRDSEFQEAIETVPEGAFDCFSARWAAALVKSDSAVGVCQQAVIVRELRVAIDRGDRIFAPATEKALPKMFAECGRLDNAVTTTFG
jgi:hypothetical protein